MWSSPHEPSRSSSAPRWAIRCSHRSPRSPQPSSPTGDRRRRSRSTRNELLSRYTRCDVAARSELHRTSRGRRSSGAANRNGRRLVIALMVQRLDKARAAGRTGIRPPACWTGASRSTGMPPSALCSRCRVARIAARSRPSRGTNNGGYARRSCESCWPPWRYEYLALCSAYVAVAAPASAQPAMEPSGAVALPEGPAQAWLLADLDSGAIPLASPQPKMSRARTLALAHPTATPSSRCWRWWCWTTYGRTTSPARQLLAHRGRMLVRRTEARPALHHPPAAVGAADGVG